MGELRSVVLVEWPIEGIAEVSALLVTAVAGPTLAVSGPETRSFGWRDGIGNGTRQLPAGSVLRVEVVAPAMSSDERLVR